MSVWSTRRQLLFIVIFILILSGLSFAFIISNRRAPSCADGIKNGDELGVDCGALCLRVCPVEVSDIVILWTKIFKVSEGNYDVAAYIENPNPFGLIELNYQFRIYDSQNIPVKDIKGKTYLNPNERILIFEPKINVGFRDPTRAVLTFGKIGDWKRLDIKQKPLFSLSNQKIDPGPPYSLNAIITNDSIFDFYDIELSALLHNEDGNVVHVGRTYVDVLDSGKSKEFTFTWPGSFVEPIKSADILPRIDVVNSSLRND